MGQILKENEDLKRRNKRRKRNLLQLDEGEKGVKNLKEDVMITGVRYAWSDMPCCPQAIEMWPQRNYNYECQEAQCAIYAQKYDLPAIPFMYKVNRNKQRGKCLIPL